MTIRKDLMSPTGPVPATDPVAGTGVSTDGGSLDIAAGMVGGMVSRTGPRRAWTLLMLSSIARTLLWVIAGLALWATLPLVLGWQPTTVMSDSMAPRIRTGDIVVARPIHLQDTTAISSLVPGRVLLVDDPDHPGRLRLHYVRTTDTGQLILRGDADAQDDSSPVAPAAVHGIAALRIPYAGLPITWARDGNLVALTGLALAALALLALTRLDPHHRLNRERHQDDHQTPHHPDDGPPGGRRRGTDRESGGGSGGRRGPAGDPARDPPDDAGGAGEQDKPGDKPGDGGGSPTLREGPSGPGGEAGGLDPRGRPHDTRTAPRSLPPRGRAPRLRAAAAVLALTASLTVVGSASAALSTSTGNPANTWAALPYYTCSAAVLSDNPYLWWRFDEAAGAATAADSSGNNRPGAYTGGTTLGGARACPHDTGTAVTLNGTTGYIGAGTGAAAVAGPTVFTIEVWFKTATAGGKLLGFAGSPTGQSTTYDRHLFLNNTGNLVFGVYPGAVKVIVSPKTYTDNTWHHAAATLSPAGGTQAVRRRRPSRRRPDHHHRPGLHRVLARRIRQPHQLGNQHPHQLLLHRLPRRRRRLPHRPDPHQDRRPLHRRPLALARGPEDTRWRQTICAGHRPPERACVDASMPLWRPVSPDGSGQAEGEEDEAAGLRVRERLSSWAGEAAPPSVPKGTRRLDTAEEALRHSSLKATRNETSRDPA